MITLNNYEEYFLLLADHELSPAEEMVVQQFAAQHPQLQEELQLLLSCRLDATDMPAFPKEMLLRPTIWNVENPAPLYTQMLSLLDNELPAPEKEQLQQQIAKSPVLQAEWDTLQKTILSAEAVAHPNKSSLYRQHKIRPLVWMRRAAAAAIIALAWLLWPAKTNHGLSSSLIAITPATNQKIVHPTQPDHPGVHDKNPTQQITDHPSTDAVVVTPQRSEATEQTTNKATERTFAVKPVNNPKKETERALFKEELIVQDPEDMVITEQGTATLNTNNSLAATLSKEENITVQTAQFAPKTTRLSPDALQSTMAMNINESEEHDGYVQIAGARFDKHKVRSLFRGITRSVTRTFSKSKIQPTETAYTNRSF